MDRLAGSFLSNGDVANASSLYNSLEKLNPTKYSRMARICRVLLDPQAVPLPHRHRDICEALLDPLVPPEVLLRDSVEDVQKTFQRLAVCVHPDKNPNPSAKDAFLRLTAMKDKALTLLRDGAERKRDSGAAAAPSAAATAAPPGRQGKPKAHGTSPPPAASGARSRRPLHPAAPPPLSTAAGSTRSSSANVSNSIAQLRSTKITLNALKRKDIADDFEIFSATARATAAQSDAGLDDVEDDHLAATVPVMPPKERPPRVCRRRAHPPAAAEKPSSAPPPVSSTSTPFLSSSLGEHGPAMSPPAPCPLPGTGTSQQCGSGSETREAELAASSPTSNEAAEASDIEAIRRQIDAACATLREMRLQHTAVRLNLDLSFEAYERNKGAA